MLTIGDKFPSFDLKAVVSTDPKTAFTQVSDKSDKGKWKVVFFWPKDFMCLEAHEKVCREHLSPEQIQAAVRIAATVHAVARTLAAEEALAAPLAQARGIG